MATPKLNPLYKFQFEKAQDAFVLLYPEGMITLNGSAGEIMQMVDGERDVDTIISDLIAKFPGAEGIDKDIHEFLDHAHEKKWIKYVD